MRISYDVPPPVIPLNQGYREYGLGDFKLPMVLYRGEDHEGELEIDETQSQSSNEDLYDQQFLPEYEEPEEPIDSRAAAVVAPSVDPAAVRSVRAPPSPLVSFDVPEDEDERGGYETDTRKEEDLRDMPIFEHYVTVAVDTPPNSEEAGDDYEPSTASKPDAEPSSKTDSVPLEMSSKVVEQALKKFFLDLQQQQQQQHRQSGDSEDEGQEDRKEKKKSNQGGLLRLPSQRKEQGSGQKKETSTNPPTSSASSSSSVNSSQKTRPVKKSFVSLSRGDVNRLSRSLQCVRDILGCENLPPTKPRARKRSCAEEALKGEERQKKRPSQ